MKKINVATSLENAKVQKEESEKPIIKSKATLKDTESEKDNKPEEEEKIIQDNVSETQDSSSHDLESP